MSVRVDASDMPSLDAFDDEFGREDSDIEAPPKARFRISTVLGLALAAAVISALALGWPYPPGGPRSESEQASGEKPEAAIRRLTSEVEALKQANRELAQAQRQAAQTITALQAGEQERSATLASWYSDVRALTYQNPFSEAASGSTNGQRSATAARPKPRDALRPDDDAPISLQPPQ
jgi:FtsZ-binding cell division protein ZapB